MSSGFGLIDHFAGDELGEEIGAFEIDLDNAVEGFFGGVEDIDAGLGGDAALFTRRSMRPKVERVHRGVFGVGGSPMSAWMRWARWPIFDGFFYFVGGVLLRT